MPGREELAKKGCVLSNGDIIFDGDRVVDVNTNCVYKVSHNGWNFIMANYETDFPAEYILRSYVNKVVKLRG